MHANTAAISPRIYRRDRGDGGELRGKFIANISRTSLPLSHENYDFEIARTVVESD